MVRSEMAAAVSDVFTAIGELYVEASITYSPS